MDRDLIRRRYARAAGSSRDPMIEGGGTPGALNYGRDELLGLPVAVAEMSLGCANPVALADLHVGEVVLDLGSGAGLDVLLAARRVAPTGKVYGLDMTDEMLSLARRNQLDARVDNVEFIKGVIEDVPLRTASVDVVMSNCVVNLSTDKRAVLEEAFRVLKGGGRLAIADVVDIDPRGAQRAEVTASSPCLEMALARDAYVNLLADVGFSDVTMATSHETAPGFESVLIRATKPDDSPS